MQCNCLKNNKYDTKGKTAMDETCAQMTLQIIKENIKSWVYFFNVDEEKAEFFIQCKELNMPDEFEFTDSENGKIFESDEFIVIVKEEKTEKEKVICSIFTDEDDKCSTTVSGFIVTVYEKQM